MRYVLVILILIAAVGAGFYFYSNSQNFNNQKHLGTNANTNPQTLPQAKVSEIVELKNGDSYNLTAGFIKKEINGQTVKMLAYNGSIPGPTIKVAQGSEVTINFKNETDVDSTIHSHGVRLDNQFDGVPDITQKPVKSGETFQYKIKFPDAGMFWYHPHIREDYTQELGLYGNYLVVPTDTNYWSQVNEEIPLFLDDILMEGANIAPFNSAFSDHALMGRFGNVMLANGDPNYQLNVKQGEVVRFYITNSSNTRTFDLSIPNAKIKLVGGDNGKVEREEFVDSIILSPSERSIIEVLFDQPGSYQIQHNTPQKTYKLANINVSTDKSNISYLSNFNTLRVNQDIISGIDKIRTIFTGQPDKRLTISLDMMGNANMMGGQGTHMMGNGSMMGNSQMMMGEGDTEKIEWEDTMGMMNTNATSKMLKWKIVDQSSNKSNMDINWQFKVGDKVKLSIFNDPKSAHPMQHPIHIHGQKFLVLSTNGVQNNDLVWKDTVLVQKGDTVEVLVDMENPGNWLIHCHIPEHMESGMMTQFKVD